MVNLPIRDIPGASGTPNKTTWLAMDNGVSMQKTTVQAVVEAGRPTASELEALQGIDNTNVMTSLRVDQHLQNSLPSTPVGRDILNSSTSDIVLALLGGGTTGIDVFKSETQADGRTALNAQQQNDALQRVADGDLYGVPDPTGVADGQVIARDSSAPSGFSFTAAGTGDMQASAYDPTGVNADAFDSANQRFTPPGTGAVPSSVQSVLADHLRVSVFRWLSEATIVKVLFRSASATEAAEITAAFVAGRDWLGDRGGGVLFCPGGRYHLDATVGMNRHGVVIDGDRGSTDIYIEGNQVAFRGFGDAPKTQGNLLATDGSRGDNSITLATGKGANFAPDQFVIIFKNEQYDTSNTQNVAQIIQLTDVQGDVLHFNSRLTYGFTVAAGAEVYRLDLIRDTGLRNLSIYAADPEANDTGLTSWLFCLRPVLENVTLGHCSDHGAYFAGCVDADVKVNVHDLASDNALALYGYAVEESGANLGGKFDIAARRVRHAYTTTTSSVLPGEPVGSRITGVAVDCWAAAWDTHMQGSMLLFDGCQVVGGDRVGFQIRTRLVTIQGGSVTGTTGAAVWIVGTGTNRFASDVTVQGLLAHRTNLGIDPEGNDWRERGAIFDQGIRSRILDNRITECGGPGIMGDGTLFADAEWCDNRVQDPCALTSGKRYAIGYEGTRTTDLLLLRNTVRGNASYMQRGIYVPSANVGVVAQDNRVTGASLAKMSLNGAHYASMNPAQNLMLGIGPGVGITIAGGVATLPGSNTGYGLVNLTGEGSTADDLATIVAGEAAVGALVTLRVAVGPITVKHNTGNILLGDAVDIVLSSSRHCLTLRWDGSNWTQWPQAY